MLNLRLILNRSTITPGFNSYQNETNTYGIKIKFDSSKNQKIVHTSKKGLYKQLD